MKDYCHDCDMSLERFKYHLYKSRRNSNSHQTPSFIPISFQSSSQIEIQYVNGVKLLLSPDTPVSFIKSLIA
jgi:hypothetical protein